MTYDEIGGTMSLKNKGMEMQTSKNGRKVGWSGCSSGNVGGGF